MMRLSSLIVCASILACAMAQTTTPPNEYIFRDQHNKTCIRMVANITVNFVYENETNGMPAYYNYTFVDAEARVDDEQSQCSTKLVLIFDPPEDEGDANYVTFNFAETGDKKAWTSETIQYDFTITKEEFPNSTYNYTRFSYTSTNKLLDQNVDLAGSYKCNANEDIKFNSSTSDYQVNVTLQVVNLQVQAYFLDGKEEFDTATECVADGGSKGNKIVPIAVGAALAGLVIVVLIAYLIGRLKSRRQSSYEALS